MKNITYKYLLIGLIGVFTFNSCEKWIDPDLNLNPDSPVDAPMNVILPAIQAEIAYHSGCFDIAGVTSMWMQQIEGASRQAQIIGNYTFVSSNTVNLWNSFYRDADMDLSILIQKSREELTKSPYYEGIAKILLAYDMGLATQLWGDVPYTEAWKGLENKHPVYDAQENLYASIQSLLDEAIVLLQSDAADNIFDPAEGDMIYEGDPQAWIMAANALKARFILHTSKRNSNAYQLALDYIAAGALTSNGDDCQFQFGLGDTEASPLFQFDEQRTDAGHSVVFTDLLISSNRFIVGVDTMDDPRMAVFQTESDETGIRTFGSYFGAKDSPVHLITYVEQLFIQAEAYYNIPNETDAKTSLIDAISASLDKFGVSDATWLDNVTAKINTLTGQALLNEIMTQKYIALFMQPEVFVDWRRTGIPDLEPVTGDQIPRRFPYSEEERNFNRNVPTITSIFARNWFDIE